MAGEGHGPDEAHPDRHYRFSAARPLWFGPRSALPPVAPASENFLATVARWQPDPRFSLGATVTSALLTGSRCSVAESQDGDDDSRPAGCDALAGNAAALDASLHTRDGEWFLRGQVTASQAKGGSPERTLPDGVKIRPGDLGYGAHAAVGRAGGEPWRFELHWEYESPKLDVNALGYQRTQNEQVGRAILHYVRPTGGGPFHSYDSALVAETHVTTDGRGLQRGAGLYQNSTFQLQSFDTIGNEAWLDLDQWNVREIDQASVASGLAAAPLAVRQPGDVGGDLWATTDTSRAVALEVGGGGGWSFPRPNMPVAPSWFFWANLTVRPHARLETRLNTSWGESRWSGRWVTNDSAANPLDRQFLFAKLSSPTLSITLRQQLVLTPRLTLQAYGQLFTSYGRYRGYRLATAHDGRVGYGDLQDEPGAEHLSWWSNPDFRSGTLVLNMVLRWEYRLGSTLYFVYSRTQNELGITEAASEPAPPYTLRPVRLGPGPTVDTILVKWSYWWSR